MYKLKVFDIFILKTMCRRLHPQLSSKAANVPYAGPCLSLVILILNKHWEFSSQIYHFSNGLVQIRHY